MKYKGRTYKEGSGSIEVNDIVAFELSPEFTPKGLVAIVELENGRQVKVNVPNIKKLKKIN